MIKELRVFGPPGTGKTSELEKRIAKAAKLVGSDRILVSSFTKAAAQEIASRGIPVDRENVGTLHSIMYRALNHPELTAGHIDDWNKEHPLYTISKGSASLDEAVHEVSFGQTIGDRCMSLMSIARARMIPKETWSQDVLNFSENWDEWKTENSLMDFTDLIETGLNDFDAAPGYPSIGFFDEAQDFVKLQIELIRKWAKYMNYIMMSGDDDQCIFSFSGSTPEVFLNPPIDDKYKTILSQSYRVPAAVHVIAEKWIKQLKVREPKEYKPRDYEGSVIKAADNVNFNKPHMLMQYLDRIKDDKSVMILATCSYMLNETIKFLKSEGIPFHNPFRRTRGDWNPIKKGSLKRVSAIDRILAYLLPSEGFPPVWGIDDLGKWIAPLQSKGVLTRGSKNLISKWYKSKKKTPDNEDDYKLMIYQLFEPDISTKLLNMLNNEIEIKWYLSHLLKAKAKTFDFPVRVIEKRGVDTLQEQPKIVVGTVHSVKGGECDDVILFPDLSYAGSVEWNGNGEGHESIIRQFYVGMTRCRERLIICAPGSAGSVRI